MKYKLIQKTNQNKREEALLWYVPPIMDDNKDDKPILIHFCRAASDSQKK